MWQQPCATNYARALPNIHVKKLRTTATPIRIPERGHEMDNDYLYTTTFCFLVVPSLIGTWEMYLNPYVGRHGLAKNLSASLKILKN